MRRLFVIAGLFLACAAAAPAWAAPTIVNPSFESDDRSDNPGVGYGPITGWTGGSGTNDASQPFQAESGSAIPDGVLVAFQQGVGTLSQNVSGFETGKTYQLTYRENSRGNSPGQPDIEVRLDGLTIVPRHFVAKTPVYSTVTSGPFTYTGVTGTGVLALQNFTPATDGTNDNTVLWDNFQIAEVPEPASLGVLALGGLTLLARRRRR